MNMPPFSRLLRLVVRGGDEKSASDDMKKISDVLSGYRSEKIQILGPAPCMLNKINNKFRFQLLLKSRNISDLQEIIRKESVNFKIKRSNHLEIDVDPTDLF